MIDGSILILLAKPAALLKACLGFFQSGNAYAKQGAGCFFLGKHVLRCDCEFSVHHISLFVLIKAGLMALREPYRTMDIEPG